MTIAQIDGHDLAYESFGEGEPLVLIMGIGGQGIFWPDNFCLGLAAQGFQVIRFDNRDIGESSKYDHLGRGDFRRILLRRALGLKTAPPYSLTDMAGDVVALLDYLGVGTAHVLGMSMGGMIAQRLAIHFPERVRSLTSVMSSDGRIWIGRIRALKVLVARPPRSRDEAIEQGLRAFRIIGSPGFERDEGALRDMIGRSYDRGRHSPGVARQLAAILADPPRTKLLNQVKIPSLVIHGAEDPLVPVAAGRATAKALPQAMYREVAGMGHDLPPGVWPMVIESVTELARRAGGAHPVTSEGG